MQVGVSSFSKLIRMICVILSLIIGLHFVGLSFSKSLRFDNPKLTGIILNKKTAFNTSYNRFVYVKSCVTIRV
jgi:hypothetical protein